MSLVVDKYLLWTFILGAALLFIGIIVDVPLLFVLTMILFESMMLFCYRKLENRILLFVFGMSFFVFLIGREFIELYFGYKVERYSIEINNHTYICLSLSILFIWITYYLSEKRNRDNSSVAGQEETYTVKTVRKLSKYVFYFSIPFAIGMRLMVARFVRGASYFDYYTDFSDILYGNTFLYYISRLENLVPVSLGIMCATFPSKEEIKWPFIFYFAYLIISLGGGNRGACLLGMMYIFVFLVYMQGVRPSENWFKRKYIYLLLLSFPGIAMLSSIMSMSRTGDVSTVSLFQSFIDFFYNQGVTITVIKHGYEYADQIPKQGPYLLEFIHSGIPARLLGIAVYHGNTTEHALYGGSFTHSLAYTFMRGAYLAGRGTGSSYIAELYYDLGYFGVAAGNVLYGWLFNKLNGFKQNLFLRAVMFTVLTQFLWAPRGGYSGFLGFLFAPTTLIAFAFVWGMTNLLRGNARNISR